MKYLKIKAVGYFLLIIASILSIFIWGVGAYDMNYPIDCDAEVEQTYVFNGAVPLNDRYGTIEGSFYNTKTHLYENISIGASQYLNYKKGDNIVLKRLNKQMYSSCEESANTTIIGFIMTLIFIWIWVFVIFV
jgi:hypothetical protein